MHHVVFFKSTAVVITCGALVQAAFVEFLPKSARGLASLAASDDDVTRLASVYWFTVECSGWIFFWGLVRVFSFSRFVGWASRLGFGSVAMLGLAVFILMLFVNPHLCSYISPTHCGGSHNFRGGRLSVPLQPKASAPNSAFFTNSCVRLCRQTRDWVHHTYKAAS